MQTKSVYYYKGHTLRLRPMSWVFGNHCVLCTVIDFKDGHYFCVDNQGVLFAVKDE